MLEVCAIRALADNYIWALCNGRAAVVVDPGEALPVLEFLEARGLELQGILVTHHHYDHTGGIAELVSEYDVPVYGPVNPSIKTLTHQLQEGASIEVLATEFTVLEIPGHTLDHIAFYSKGLVFTGDTLFVGGCGRVFEGTYTQMFNSLKKLSKLPKETAIYCGHEYSLANLRFASLIEPTNQGIHNLIDTFEAKLASKVPTVPSKLSTELQVNPFLRCNIAAVRRKIAEITGKKLDSDLDAFTALRQLKDNPKPH